MEDQAHAETVAVVVDMLVSALTELGLSAEGFGGSMVWVTNRAADPPSDGGPRAWRMSPGLRQMVQCHMDEMGRLAWFWVWHTPGAMPEHEWIAPASDINSVAARIARVLAVRPETVS